MITKDKSTDILTRLQKYRKKHLYLHDIEIYIQNNTNETSCHQSEGQNQHRS